MVHSTVVICFARRSSVADLLLIMFFSFRGKSKRSNSPVSLLPVRPRAIPVERDFRSGGCVHGLHQGPGNFFQRPFALSIQAVAENNHLPITGTERLKKAEQLVAKIQCLSVVLRRRQG